MFHVSVLPDSHKSLIILIIDDIAIHICAIMDICLITRTTFIVGGLGKKYTFHQNIYYCLVISALWPIQ